MIWGTHYLWRKHTITPFWIVTLLCMRHTLAAVDMSSTSFKKIICGVFEYIMIWCMPWLSKLQVEPILSVISIVSLVKTHGLLLIFSCWSFASFETLYGLPPIHCNCTFQIWVTSWCDNAPFKSKRAIPTRTFRQRQQKAVPLVISYTQKSA